MQRHLVTSSGNRKKNHLFVARRRRHREARLPGQTNPKKMTESEEEQQQELVLRRRRRRVVTLQPLPIVGTLKKNITPRRFDVNAKQADVRGYLVRKRFQSLKGEYERIVNEIEEDLDWLKWNKHSIPVPVFLPKKSIKARELCVQQPRANKNKLLHEKEAALCFQAELLTKNNPDSKMQLPSSFPAEVVAETVLEKEHLEGRPQGNACNLPGETEEGKHTSSILSECSSSIFESPRLSQELHFPKVPEMPQAVPDLQRYRKHLAMELLWLQQAIASRKNYLILKQKLGSPE